MVRIGIIILLVAFCQGMTRHDRIKRSIGIFNVVRFPNEVCDGSNDQQGTCYTTEECEDRGGESSGSCAEGYGVCCTFSINCGQRSSQNNTVFASNNPESGPCSASICKMDDTISQLRLDFTTFAIGDPSDGAAGTSFSLLNGVADPAGGAVAHTTAGQCEQDSFVVTSPGSGGSDIICGTNSGEHLYVDASDACDELLFILGPNAATAEWSITVRQYAHDYTNLAPRGCDQYHFDNDDNDALATTGTVQSFNFNNGNGRHLANQDQTICIRREAGMQRVCFSQAGGTVINDFQISSGAKTSSMVASSGLVGKFTGAASVAEAAVCGNYGTDGMGIDFDFLNVPGGFADFGGAAFAVAGNDNFCGAALVAANGPALTTTSSAKQVGPAEIATSTTTSTGTAMATAMAMIAGPGQATICTSRRNFRIRFVSDAGETATETVQTGFSLGYEQA